MQLFINENISNKYSSIAQVILVAGPTELRELANFLTKCADEMELDEEWDHEHYCDRHGISTPTDINPDLAIYAPNKGL